ncbi:hypothetical protein [Teredinibacter purpureus]|uniref:hypothetical protein n=1 Tax=Teredinibacter purpureus TaxID=2731756 RepID=UPI0005F8480B|nr:hypothetical protein [Teredinibacter purpureus]
MIEWLTAGTPNGHKASLVLDALKLGRSVKAGLAVPSKILGGDEKNQKYHQITLSQVKSFLV